MHSNPNYGKTVGEATVYNAFPVIHKDTNGNYKEIDLSTQETLINGTAEEMYTNKNFTPKNTHWNRTMGSTDFKNSKYYTMLVEDCLNLPSFLLSSRSCLPVLSSNKVICAFGIRTVAQGNITYNIPFVTMNLQSVGSPLVTRNLWCFTSYCYSVI